MKNLINKCASQGTTFTIIRIHTKGWAVAIDNVGVKDKDLESALNKLLIKWNKTLKKK